MEAIEDGRAEHTSEPMAATFRSEDGREPDLFKTGDYPVWALCRVCGKPIKAQSFLLPFRHADPDAIGSVMRDVFREIAERREGSHDRAS